ncbi:MAG: hypothetical protein JKY43_09300 [Phycisphaerales bacterium]|nr:hypothetical protein [Phycisphaerales bacterium]
MDPEIDPEMDQVWIKYGSRATNGLIRVLLKQETLRMVGKLVAIWDELMVNGCVLGSNMSQSVR